eukprot:1157054-Pelagomonas_calceolata.AAC.9
MGWVLGVRACEFEWPSLLTRKENKRPRPARKGLERQQAAGDACSSLMEATACVSLASGSLQC